MKAEIRQVVPLANHKKCRSCDFVLEVKSILRGY